MKGKKIAALISAVTMFISAFAPMTAIHAESPTTLTVDANAQVEDATTFKTIRAAVAKANELNPASEANRVTINVKPGDYEEQVKLKGLNYVTIQKDPSSSEEKVTLHWYYYPNYSAANCNLDGEYDDNIDWSDEKTWKGPDGNDNLTEYKVGQEIENQTISYYDKSGTKHENVSHKRNYLGEYNGYSNLGALIIEKDCHDITLNGLDILNSVPLMVTQGEKDGHLTPSANADPAPDRSPLTICGENTTETRPSISDIFNDDEVDKAKYNEYVKNNSGHIFTGQESAFLVRTSPFNATGHALTVMGDRVTVEDCRVTANQDALYVANGRHYFKNCDLQGGTDFIYGDATVVFDNCKLANVGFADRAHGIPIAASNQDPSVPYGYLFYECTIYNLRAGEGETTFGRAWRQAAQNTYYKTIIDDNGEAVGKAAASISEVGWNGMSGNAAEKARFYEYGTTNNSGADVDTSKRVKNENGFGTVLDDWQILEFNPRNYLKSRDGNAGDGWDPMNFAAKLVATDAELAKNKTITIAEGTETSYTLPTPDEESGVEFKWESNSPTATVNEDGKSITFMRPAAGEADIRTELTLYAKNKTTGFGDKQTVELIIEPTTDSENVFNAPVIITASSEASENCPFKVDVYKDAALIKTATITLEQGEKLTGDVLDNLPSSGEDSVTYDVVVTPVGNEYTVTLPENGKGTITGTTGSSVTLNIEAVKVAEEKTALAGTSFDASGLENAYLDLIALAKENDADAAGHIENSDVITVEYDITPNNTDVRGYIDLRANQKDSCSESPDKSRFTLTRAYQWSQFDTIDCTLGAFNEDAKHGKRAISGKIDNNTTETKHHIKTTIDYKAKTITVDAKGTAESSFVFTGFPENAEKGNLFLCLYPLDKYSQYRTAKWILDNISVTYLKPEAIGTSSSDSTFDMPITVTQEAADEEVTYTVTVKSGNTVVASKDVTVAANDTSASGADNTITGLDTSKTYTVTVSCNSDKVGLTSDSEIQVKGIKDQPYPLEITAGTKKPYSVEYLSSMNGFKGYTLDYSGTKAVHTGNGTTGYTFNENFPAELKKIVKDADSENTIADKYTSKLSNYMGGTGSSDDKCTHPYIDVDLPAGSYTIYYLGTADRNSDVFATYDGKDGEQQTFTKIAKAATSGTTNLDVYTRKLDLAEAYKGEIYFNISDTWLPDTYAVIIAGMANPVAEPVDVNSKKSVTLDVSYTPTTDDTTIVKYDLIDLAKEKGADASIILSSDEITVEYDLKINTAIPYESNNRDYFDFTNGSTRDAGYYDNKKDYRYLSYRIRGDWNQLDTSSGIGQYGENNKDTTDMHLNISDKFVTGSTYHVTAKINYKDKTVNAACVQNPLSAVLQGNDKLVQGKLALVIYPSGKNDYTISNIKVSYLEKREISTVMLNANDGQIAGGKDVTEYIVGVGAQLPTALDMTKEGHSFGGWYESENFEGSPVTKIPADATENKTYYAKWNPETYTITWIADGGVIRTDEAAAYGTTITAPEIPEKTADAQYTYTASGWSGLAEDATVTGDAIYVAVYSKTLNKYTITWKNGDTTLETDTDVPYGRTTPYDGPTPTKEAEGKKYTFTGWEPKVAPVTGNQTYQAQFSEEGVTDPTPTPTPDVTDPTPVVTPLTPLEVTKLPKDTLVSFSVNAEEAEEGEIDNGKWNISKDKAIEAYVAVYANKDNVITIDGSNKTFNKDAADQRKYTSRLKLGGKVTYDTSANPAPAIRTISVTPAVAGTLVVDFAHASSTGEARSIGIYQNGKEIASKEVAANLTDTIKAEVKADEPVYIYSKLSGINIYGILINDDSVDDPIEEEVEPSPMPLGTTINFDAGYDSDAGTGTTISKTSLFGNYLKVISSGSNIEIGSSKKTFNAGEANERRYTTCLKLGGSSKVGVDGIPTDRGLSVIPAADGTLLIDFSTTNAEDPKSITLSQAGIESVTQEAAAGGVNTLTAEVKAGVPVYISSETGANIFAIILSDGSQGNDDPVIKGTCTQIVVTYVDGVLSSIKINDNFDAANIPDEIINSDTEKTFYWDSLSGMKPVTKADFEQSTTPSTPNTGDEDIEWGWQASEASIGMKAGTPLIPGLTPLFDYNSNNKAYIAGAENGGFDESGTNASMLKFVPEEDGVLKVKIVDFGTAGKELTAMICEAGTQTDDSAQTVTEKTDSIILSREVEAGKSYYVTAKGTKARFAAAAFSAQDVTKTWTVSDKLRDMPENTELIRGLTTLFKNTSTNNKYISCDEGGKLENGVGSGAALKYEAYAEGTLTVTMIDVGLGKNPVIYDYTERKDAYSYEATEDGETVELTANVVTGHTYYITATGTKGRFSAASFTPKKAQ